MFDSVWAQLIQRLAGLFSSSTLRTLRNPSGRAVVPSAKAGARPIRGHAMEAMIVVLMIVFASMFAAAQRPQDQPQIQISGVVQPRIEIVKQSALKQPFPGDKSLIMNKALRFDPSPGSHFTSEYKKISREPKHWMRVT